MAYVAVNSLIYTVRRLLKLSYISTSHISIAPPYREIIIFAYEEFQSSLQVLSSRSNESINRESLNVLDGEIRDTLCKLEDVLESHISDHFLSQSDESPGGDQACSLTPTVVSEIDSLTKSLKKMTEAYINELSNPLPDEEEEDDAAPLRICFSGNKSKVVGLSNQFSTIRDQLTVRSRYEVKVVSLFGMAGIGKTAIAEKIFEDPSILSCFELRAFVTIGSKCQLKEIIKFVLAQVRPDFDQMLVEEDEKLAECLYESLRGQRYLIVLDDVWTIQVLEDLIGLFPDMGTGARVLLTTRLEEVAKSCAFWAGLKIPDKTLGEVVTHMAMVKSAAILRLFGFNEIPFLSKQDSWHLLREKVFGEESTCPSELEEAGKKIAENCEGLPLTIVTIADILSKAEKTAEFWNNVAAKKSSVFADAYDQMLKVLLPSYNSLPQQLKPCFLYMGVYPEKHEIACSRLIDLWIADGILELANMSSISLAKVSLEKLVACSVVMVRQRSFADLTKTFSLHSSFWYLCNKEAEKNKFFHGLNTGADGFTQGIECQRRLCIRNNILFAIKDVHNSMESISTARSLLCTGPYHQYPVPVCCGLMLLRILDALTIRFYDLPMEVLKLIHLRYFSLTYDGELPVSISKLWNLEYLIVNRHLSIYGILPYLHLEIWDMQQLRHLQVMGSDLPDPREGSSLPNLFKLLDVSARSCTKDVLQRIPNLRKLGIRIELPPNAEVPFSCLDHISLLPELRSLKCVIVNPIGVPRVVTSRAPLSIFSASLKKLTLSGFGYPWEEMKLIAALPKLLSLKLLCDAFRGPTWETLDGGFPNLGFLLIEDIDVAHWTVGSRSFPVLQFLSLKHCYKLKEIPETLGKSLVKIEVVDCSRVAVSCAKQIKEDQFRRGKVFLEVNVQSSWEG